MPLFALGLNYRTAPIEVRERVAFPLEWSVARRTLTFDAVISPWNSMIDPYWTIDLHPADAETHEQLAALVRE